jgi:hypothetical protein
VDEYELADRAYALPGRFADRLDPGQPGGCARIRGGGEWIEEIDLLLACLGAAGPVTAAERGELEAMGMPTGLAEELPAEST